MESEKDKYKELIVAYFSGNLNDEEYGKLNSWLEEDDRNVTYLTECSHIWLAFMALSNHKGFDAKNAYNKFEQRVNASLEMKDDTDVIKSNRFKIIFTFLRIAAVILVSLGLGLVANYFYSNRTNTSLATFHEIVAPLGSKTQVILPDQSVVVLNAGSKVRYFSDFGVKNREIWLQGEGYFTVFKNKKKRFIVRAGSLAIIALGTQFNVKAYTTEGIIETTLVEGKLKIERIQIDSRNLKKVACIGFLNPNERLIYKDDHVEKVANKTKEENTPYNSLIRASKLDITHSKNISFDKNVDLHPFISWMGKRWVIKGEELGKLAVDLERKYDVKITFENERLKHFRFSGTFEDESIQQVVKAVSLSSPVLFKIDGKSIYLKYNSQFMTTDDQVSK